MTDDLYKRIINNQGVQQRSALRSIAFNDLTAEEQLIKGHQLAVRVEELETMVKFIYKMLRVKQKELNELQDYKKKLITIRNEINHYNDPLLVTQSHDGIDVKLDHDFSNILYS